MKSKKEKTKDPRGGKRQGAGRKPLYDEETVRITVRVPKSKVNELRTFIKSFQDIKS